MASAHDRSFAVLLNPNARRVGGKVLDRVSEIVDPDHVFVSRDPAEADQVTREILDRGYDTVFTGGGDGTVTRFINRLPLDHAPRIGILRLGTGNAMAQIVSSGDPFTDLRTYVSNPSRDSVPLALCESEGTRFAFAGLGLDAAVLNDFEALRLKLGSGALRRIMQNLGGYFAAGLGMTVPRMAASWLRGRRAEVRVTNIGTRAYAIDPDAAGSGRVGVDFEPDQVLYEGPVNGVLFGTCPFYGYRLKALPFAGVEPSLFHLRLSNVPLPRLLLGMRKLWRGTLRHPGMMDFHVNRVRLEFSAPMPYQLAGEAMGYREELTVGLAQSPVDLVRFI